VSGPPYLDAEAVRAALRPSAAVDAVRAALLGGLDPAHDIPRSSVPVRGGEYLLMPADAGRSAGIKVLTVAPDNPARGMPRIQGLYILADAETLAPRAVLDGAALTLVRTPAVSLAAVGETLRRSAEPLDVVVFGAGPQARAHSSAVRDLLEGVRSIARVTTVTRRPDRARADHGAVACGSAEADAALRRAGLVICATTGRTPLFDSAALREDSVVVAVGSHEPDARELDAALMGRAAVIVEDVGTALREAGDVVLAVRERALDPAALLPLRDVVRGEVTISAGRPLVFKSTGMSWEDLVIAEAIVQRTAAEEERRADAQAAVPRLRR
jgi:ornithine cyclodeaminase